MSADARNVLIFVCADNDETKHEVTEGITVAKALGDLGYPVKTPCGGMGHCCSCTTKIWRFGEESSTRVRACREIVQENMCIYPAQENRRSWTIPPAPKISKP